MFRRDKGGEGGGRGKEGRSLEPLLQRGEPLRRVDVLELGAQVCDVSLRHSALKMSLSEAMLRLPCIKKEAAAWPMCRNCHCVSAYLAEG